MSDLETGNRSEAEPLKKLKESGVDELRQGIDDDQRSAENSVDRMVADADQLEAEADKFKDPEAPETDISPENSNQPLDMRGILEEALGSDPKFAELNQMLKGAESHPVLVGGSDLQEAAVAVDQMRMALEMYAQGVIEKAQILFNKGKPHFVDALERRLAQEAAQKMEGGLGATQAFAEVSKGFLQDSARLELGKAAA